MMLRKSILLARSGGVGSVRRMATHQMEGSAETQKQAAESIFQRTGMWPLVLLTAVVGYFGYQYRKSVNLGPNASVSLPSQKTPVMEKLQQEAKNEGEYRLKVKEHVDKERDKDAEKVWSRGTMEKGAFETSPEDAPHKPSEHRK